MLAGEWYLAEKGKFALFINYEHSSLCTAKYTLRRKEFLSHVYAHTNGLSGPAAKTQLTSLGLEQSLRTVQRYVQEDCVQGSTEDMAEKIALLPSLLDEIFKANPGSTYHIDVDEIRNEERELQEVRLVQACLILKPAWETAKTFGHKVFALDGSHRRSKTDKHVWLSLTGEDIFSAI